MSWSLGNVGTGGNGGGSNSVASSAFSLTTGQNLIGICKWEDAARTPTFNDTAGNVIIRLTVRNNSGGPYGCLYYALNATGNASNVVTGDFGSFTAQNAIVTAEFTSTNSASFVAEDFGTANSTSVTSTAISPSSGDLTVCGLCEYTAGNWTAGTGYTLAGEGTSGSQNTGLEYKLNSGTSESPSGTYSNSALLIAIAAAFHESAGGGASVHTPYFYRQIGGM